MPRIRNSEGIIIKIAPKGETSLIVHVFSNEWGKVALIAKGARQPKSHLRGILEPFSQVNFHFSEIRDRPWQFLTQAEFINPMTHLKNSSEAILYGSVLLEIIYRSQENHGDPNVYRLLKEALNAMNCGISPLPVHWAFILKYCQFQGAPLNLQTCYSCGKALEKAYFHPYEGFNYCGICSGQK